MNPELPVRFETMTELIEDSRAYARFRGALVSFFSLLALGIAVAGIGGVISYLVSQRTTEIGLRLALGASPVDVFRMVVGGSMRLVLLGLGLGLAITLGLLRLFLGKVPFFAMQPDDPWVLVFSAAVLTLAALFAASLPALRASMLDPLAALRSE
jgi:putative ABC transport system permease protein